MLSESPSGGVPKPKAGILIDEEFGAAILRDAGRKAYDRVSRGKERAG